MTKILKKFISYSLFSLCLIVLTGGHAQANITLDKVVLDFVPGSKPVQNLLVTNNGDKTLKVTGKIVKIEGSGQENEVETETKNLVLAPKSFEIAPGAQRQVRLVLRGFPENAEDIYRVRFSPDKPDVMEQNPKAGMSVKVGVILTIGALVMVKPKNPKSNLTYERVGDVIRFNNQGNVTAQLQREEFCNDDRTDCVPLTGKRIYPGVVWDYPIPEALKSKSFTQTVLINGQYSKLSF